MSAKPEPKASGTEQKSMTSYVSVDLRRFAMLDVVCFEVDRLLREFHGADLIEITVRRLDFEGGDLRIQVPAVWPQT